MPSVTVDFLQVGYTSVSSENTQGNDFVEEGVHIPVIVPSDQVADWLATYDPSSESSPTAANSRVIARAVLDALKRFSGT